MNTERVVDKVNETNRNSNVVTSMIREGDLPLYEQAGLLSGYRVTVDARAGETARFLDRGIQSSGDSKKYTGSSWRSLIVPQGQVHVQITTSDPVQNKDHEPFWRTLNELRQARSPQAKT